MKNRYSALLFFQYRVDIGGVSNKRRTCEKRIITFSSSRPHKAYEIAEKRGKASNYSYENNDENTVYFEFVGVMDLLKLGVECDDDEVWYEIREYVSPMERKKGLIPRRRELINSLSLK